MRVHPGEIRTPLTLQVVVESTDSYGQRTETWSSVGTVWAKVSPFRGNEDGADRQRQSWLTYRILIRNYPGLTTKHRFSGSGTIYDIREIRNEDFRNVYQAIEAQVRT